MVVVDGMGKTRRCISSRIAYATMAERDGVVGIRRGFSADSVLLPDYIYEGYKSMTIYLHAAKREVRSAVYSTC